MDKKNSCLLVAFLVVFISMEVTFVQSQGNGNRNGNNEKKGIHDAASTHYELLSPNEETGQERVFCLARGKCQNKTLECPDQCAERKPKKNKKVKGCFIDCSSKCETTCKFRKPNCNGYGSVCYDPRFVGGDGVMFYFHGATGGDFALVSDNDLHINAHFIGTRPAGRTRDFTWIQAISVMFDSHTLVIAAKRVSHWDDNIDALIVRWDGEAVEVPTDGEAEWWINDGVREVVVERTDDTNSVRVTVTGLLEMDVKVTPIGKEENRVHNYQLPADDAFSHLETQFRFANLTDLVEGVLGKTYRPDYVTPVKIGVPMPMMGGEDKYRTLSLLSPICNACRFQRQSATATIDRYLVHNYQLLSGAAFAHLATQFRFTNLADLVEGVLGQTYRPDNVTSVKIGPAPPFTSLPCLQVFGSSACHSRR
ncbi:hypothetical protein HHK36_011131 [Tetracentron sinense]|uniref:Uncharacterized protein n=1 Tax=Tetracentron sinense TaxID=13715 RepID=A0A835DH22_TETSI|nr:hypothetical protein HHK36_011131 [Tetracentron sinense]